LNLSAQLERVEIDWTGDGHTFYLVSQALTVSDQVLRL
jgi:hypothetical protein